ncbi:MAG: hypothetical protein R3B81_15175 [bacterium]
MTSRQVARALGAAVLVAFGADHATAEEPTLDALYSRLNLRTFPSSFGQRLKACCESYPQDFFPLADVVRDADHAMTLRSGDDVWTIDLLADGRIGLSCAILSGTYRTREELALEYDDATDEWRAGPEIISRPAGCGSHAQSPSRSESGISPGPDRGVGPPSPHGEWSAAIHPARRLNETHSPDDVPETFDLAGAWLWEGKLVVRSRTVVAEPSPARAGGPAVREGHLSVLDLATGGMRRLRSWDPASPDESALFDSPGTARISGDHLVLATEGRPARIALVDLTSGDLNVSDPLDLLIDDLVLRDGRLVVRHYENVWVHYKNTGKRELTKPYDVAVLDPATFRTERDFWVGFPPILTESGLFTWAAPYVVGQPADVDVWEWSLDGKRLEKFEGSWPVSPRAECDGYEPVEFHRGERYFLAIDRCGVVRGIDLRERRVFHLPYVLHDLFADVRLSLTENLLIVQGAPKTESGEAKRQVYLLDLQTGRWSGHLDTAVSRLTAASGATDEIVLGAERLLPVDATLGSPAPIDVQLVSLVNASRPGAATVSAGFRSAPLLTPDLEVPASAPEVVAIDLEEVPLSRFAEVESTSKGEFRLENTAEFWERLAGTAPEQAEPERWVVPIAAAAGGSPLARLELAARPGYEGTSVQGRLVGPGTLRAPQVIYRAKVYPRLLVFSLAEHDGVPWYDLSDDPSRPAWIDGRSLPEPLAHAFVSRPDVVRGADEVSVRSPRRLRAGPGADTEVLDVVDYRTGILTPLDMQGDWLKVHYVTPIPADPYAEIGDEYRQMDAWIEWRSPAGEEYVEIEYHYD